MSDTENHIQNKIHDRLQMQNKQSDRPKFYDITANVNLFGWESDLLCKDAKDSIYEFEIKASFSDFLKDFRKKAKQAKLASLKGNDVGPAFFYYVVPLEILDQVKEKLPSYAGLYWFSIRKYETVLQCDTVAPKLTEYRATKTDTIKMLRSTNFKYWRGRTGKGTYKR